MSTAETYPWKPFSSSDPTRLHNPAKPAMGQVDKEMRVLIGEVLNRVAAELKDPVSAAASGSFWANKISDLGVLCDAAAMPDICDYCRKISDGLDGLTLGELEHVLRSRVLNIRTDSCSWQLFMARKRGAK